MTVQLSAEDEAYVEAQLAGWKTADEEEKAAALRAAGAIDRHGGVRGRPARRTRPADGEQPPPPPEPAHDPGAEPSDAVPTEPADQAGTVEETKAAGPPAEDVEWFWTCRPQHKHIRQAALSRRASPFGVMGYVGIQVMAHVPPDVVLGPPETMASLNLAIAVVGDTGTGKDRADNVAEAVMTFPFETDINDGEPVFRAPLGTGEGIVKSFMDFGIDPKDVKEGKPDPQPKVFQHTVSVILTCGEIDTVAAKAARQGSTFMGHLREAWFGKPFGGANSGALFRLWTRKQAYRLGIAIGVQPGRGKTLLNEDEITGGTPQRFTWAWAENPDAPDEAPAWPGTLAWEMPGWFGEPGFHTPNGLRIVPVCETALREIDADVLARHRGQRRNDPLRSHWYLNRLKWAAFFGLLAGHVGVDETDWTLSGVWMAMSDRTAAHVIETLQGVAAKANQAKGRAEGERTVAAKKVVDEADADELREACTAVVKYLGGHRDGGGRPDWMSKRDLGRKSNSPNWRKILPDAVAMLHDTGRVDYEATDYRGNPSWRVRLVEQE